MPDTHLTAASGAAALPYTLPIRFTGSGSEYFRIWIVNLMLIVVTLGIYLPWAKVRRLKYFHGNTLVGEAPLGFHGNPRQMLRGYTLVALLFGLYSVAGHFSQTAGLVALAIVMLVSSALWCAGMQFRLANTSWRGLRLRFTGGMREAYAPLLPALPLLASGFALAKLIDWFGQQPHAYWLVALAVLVVLLQAWAMVWTVWRTKKYQHSHYALGALQTAFSGRVRQFAVVLLSSAGVMLMVLAAIGGLLGLIRASGVLHGVDRQLHQAVVTLMLLAALFVLFATVKPYATTRLQNLVWNHTGSNALQFHSALRLRSMLGLTLKNWLLILVTLGLYWPFAAIAMARLRLQAVSLSTRDAPDALVAAQQAEPVSAAGDAAGDLFGLDVGL